MSHTPIPRSYRLTEAVLLKYGFEDAGGHTYEKKSPPFQVRGDLAVMKNVSLNVNLAQDSIALVEGTMLSVPYAADAVWVPYPNSEAEFLLMLRGLKFINL